MFCRLNKKLCQCCSTNFSIRQAGSWKFWFGETITRLCCCSGSRFHSNLMRFNFLILSGFQLNSYRYFSPFSHFAGVIYGFKGLILVFGLFLAYETRSIKVKQINDSRYVGMSIYNIAVLCLITAPVAMVIASQQDASFVFVALAVIFCCFLSMLLIFVPKVSRRLPYGDGNLVRNLS